MKQTTDLPLGQSAQASHAAHASKNRALLERFHQIRAYTQRIAEPLDEEDQVVQSMPDASPTKWHLAHTSWFWETVVLQPHLPGYALFDAGFAYLFNSYYVSLGPRHPRPQRGLLSRPSLSRVLAYRRHIDSHLELLLRTASAQQLREIAHLIELGLAHEQQHQELILMDILHLFAQSPLLPAYRTDWPLPGTGRTGTFQRHEGGLVLIGNAGAVFAFDNERPRHRTWVDAFEISDRLVTNRQWLRFMADGGYSTARYWLSDGWDHARTQGWEAPLYWRPSPDEDDRWSEMTLGGLQPLALDAPVGHISYYEASAYAAWAGARLPFEAEWEIAAEAGLLEQADDAAWQWTQSPYVAYPGFKTADDATGEYNGKFMSGQMVLRGGAFATPAGHARPSYRNFFRPEQRWMFSGVRLARDIAAHAGAETDREPSGAGEFERDVIQGLSKPQKSLNPKYFYDAQGSALFEQICLTPEYYPTRAETVLLKNIADELAAQLPENATLVEFGSGASEKTRIILDAARQVRTYVPIDISKTALAQARQRIEQAYPTLAVCPIEADFTRELVLPDIPKDGTAVGFFPGSTIGNFEPAEAIGFLRCARGLLGDDAKMIVGVDMIKDPSTLIDAYNDDDGATARFNLNLLERINRELGGNFNPAAFAHTATWNERLSRIEMHLVSLARQIVLVADRLFNFAPGESIHTENSHKYSIASFGALAAAAGWAVSRSWIGDTPEFGVFMLANAVGDR
nr:ergothioneine biosynthesis protein EgtB [Bordetella sp. FB-8]